MKLSVVPIHLGELLVNVGVAGVGVMTTRVVPDVLGQPPTVMTSE